MICFNHAEIESVGICKNCYKALCSECSMKNISINGLISCSLVCSKRLENIEMLIDRNIEIVLNKSALIYTIFFNLCMTLAGIYFYVKESSDLFKIFGIMLSIIGSYSIVTAIYRMLQNRKN